MPIGTFLGSRNGGSLIGICRRMPGILWAAALGVEVDVGAICRAG